MIGAAMTNWTEAAPTNPEKHTSLHDRANRPAPPAGGATALAKRLFPSALGFALAFLLVALAFQTRDSWTVGRDWVVPAAVVPAALGGVALGHLLARRQVGAAAGAILFLFIALALTGANIWRGQVVDGSDGWRNAMAISITVSMGLMMASALAGLVWVESKRPTRAPAPEV
jgi:hypothetical protein